MLDQLSDIGWMHSIQNREKILPIRLSVLRIIILQELHDFWVIFEPRIDVLDAKLIVLRYVDKFACGLGEQGLLSLEHCSYEVTIYCRNWRDIELY